MNILSEDIVIWKVRGVSKCYHVTEVVYNVIRFGHMLCLDGLCLKMYEY